jgi:hypothetical protein
LFAEEVTLVLWFVFRSMVCASTAEYMVDHICSGCRNGKYPDSHIRRHGRDSGNYWKPAWVETEMAAIAPCTIQIASFSLHVSQSSLLPCNYAWGSVQLWDWTHICHVEATLFTSQGKFKERQKYLVWDVLVVPGSTRSWTF